MQDSSTLVSYLSLNRIKLNLSLSRIVRTMDLIACFTRSIRLKPRSTYSVFPSVTPAHDPPMLKEMSTTAIRSIGGHSCTSGELIDSFRNPELSEAPSNFSYGYATFSIFCFLIIRFFNFKSKFRS